MSAFSGFVRFLLWLIGFNMTVADEVLRVGSAASLQDALKEVSVLFEKQAGVRIQLNLGASNLLARQIEEGAPMDVFLSADVAQMQRLLRNGLIDPATQKVWLSNRLVVAVPADSALDLKSGHDLAGPAVRRLALADPKAVPAGVYAREWLQSIGLWDAVTPKVIPTDNVRAALAAIESGNVEAGIVYQTDVAASKKVKVALEIKGPQSPKIAYAMAVPRAARNPSLARKFLDHLTSPASLGVFKKFGFVLPE